MNKSSFSFRIFSRKLVKSFSSYDVHVIFMIPKFSDQFLIDAASLMRVPLPTTDHSAVSGAAPKADYATLTRPTAILEQAFVRLIM